MRYIYISSKYKLRKFKSNQSMYIIPTQIYIYVAGSLLQGHELKPNEICIDCKFSHLRKCQKI